MRGWYRYLGTGQKRSATAMRRTRNGTIPTLLCILARICTRIPVRTPTSPVAVLVVVTILVTSVLMTVNRFDRTVLVAESLAISGCSSR